MCALLHCNNGKKKVGLHATLESAKGESEISSNSKIILYCDCIQSTEVKDYLS